jgi:DNA-binding transcriptional LysR family regulator
MGEELPSRAVQRGCDRRVGRCVYPPKKTVSPKVRAFLDFLAERFGKPPYWDRRMDLGQSGSISAAD